uniref:NADH dehydrogenase subunit 4 n=1 Tax=Paramecium gigas TaxID=2709424 RepID=UPI001D017629|nr:NADH dehydrogenase subunit 4 [Paramecium gigas]QVG61498.1 NADH dehydrogenase subunit 4 [Paramecium gigas]
MLLSIVFYSYFFTNRILFFQKKNDFFLKKFKNFFKKILSFFFIVIFFYLCFYINFILKYFYVFFSKVEIFNLNSSFFFFFKGAIIKLNLYGLILLLISFFTGFVAISTLNTITIEQRLKLYAFFLQFIIIIFFFIQTNDILLLFFFYELLLLGSFLIVYYSSYTIKAAQASLYFVIWTQVGSILVLLAIIYIFKVSNLTNLLLIKSFPFKKFEIWIIFLLLFFGFGFKLPIWPFHYWLTKTHVEAPSGFSIYLSGFLVKTALYGFYKITNNLHVELNTIFFIFIAVMGILDSSLKFWGQTDLKKLVAYCTIQEMNLILIFFLQGDSGTVVFGFVFTIAHTLLSTLMFFLIECIYIRFHSRSIHSVRGIFYSCSNLATVILLTLIFFSGLPGTLKFICEFHIFNLVLKLSIFFFFFFIVILNVVGLVGFCKNWLNAVFTVPDQKRKISVVDLTKKELYVCCICFLGLIFLAQVPILLI